MLKIRFANENDAEALLGIYGEYIDTLSTFEYPLPTLESYRRRVMETAAEYPFLLAEEDGVVAGFAYAHRYRERLAYRWCAETSVYLDEKFTGRGLGRALYTALFEILRLQNIKAVLAVVVAGNQASEALHERTGFSLLFRHEKVGFKCGQWADTLLYERRIDECAGEPEPFLPIGALDPAQIEKIIKAASPW